MKTIGIITLVIAIIFNFVGLYRSGKDWGEK